MSAKVRTETGDAATRQMFEQLLNTDSYVRCDNSADKMIETLIRNDFPSGAHIDYFDWLMMTVGASSSSSSYYDEIFMTFIWL